MHIFCNFELVGILLTMCVCEVFLYRLTLYPSKNDAVQLSAIPRKPYLWWSWFSRIIIGLIILFREPLLRQVSQPSRSQLVWYAMDGKRPDGLTLIPYANGRSLTWDVTVVCSTADSYIDMAIQGPALARKPNFFWVPGGAMAPRRQRWGYDWRKVRGV